jgi:CsoR family transcriptional regulator, copper-sensing transcriptional repressor
MQTKTKKSVAARLRRIEGQIGGLLRMVDNDRYCVDILNQAYAVRAAVLRVEEEILRDHVSHCVSDAFASGNLVDQRQKVDELVETFGRLRR